MGRKFFGTLSPFSVSQCLSVPVSYLFCWVARLARVQVKPGGKQIWKGIKIRPWFLKKNASNIISFCSHCWPLRQWSSVPGGGTSVPSGGFGPVFDDRAGLSQDEAAPQFTNAMTRPRPGNWPTLNIILGFRETRSELGNWGAATDQGSRRVKEKTKTEHFELIGNWKTLYFFDIKYMLMLLKCWRCANSNE